MDTSLSKKELFAKSYAQLKKEGILKSIAVAAIVGCSIGFIIALSTWFVTDAGFWIALAVTSVVIVGLSIVLYFTAYKPDEYKIARRLDRSGLDERMITMLDYKDSDTYIAARQREDAISSFGEAQKSGDKNLVRTKPRLAVVITVPIVAALFLSMILLSGLSAFGIIPSGSELWNKAFSNKTIYIVSYEGSEGGKVYGETEQKVVYGTSTSRVVAVADDGYMFDKWVDNLGNEFYNDPSRYEESVKSNIVLTAKFVKVDENEDDPEEVFDFTKNDSNGGNSGNPGELPGDPSNNNGNGNGAGSGGTEQNDYILNGETDYKEYYDGYYEEAMKDLTENGDELPPELREILEGYFEILK